MRSMPLLLAGLLLCAVARAQDPIPDVRTLDDLKKLPAIHLDKWDVRVGLADGGADAGPWKLLYCWAEYTAKGEPDLSRQFSGEPLGPVSFSAHPAGERWAEQAQCSAQMASIKDYKATLYCAIAPMSAKGMWRVQVYAPDKKVLLTRDIEVKEPAVCYWGTFATERFPGDGQVITFPETQYAFAAYPNYSGMAPLLPADRELPKGAALLPGTIPLDPAWYLVYSAPATQPADAPLELSLKDNAFLIHSRGFEMDNRAADNLLARWWVNGRPVTPPMDDRKELMQAEGRQIIMADTLRIPFGLPQYLAQLKAGDRLAVQVLYAPGGHVVLRPQAMQHMMPLAREGQVPVQSNRLEFVLTADLLKLQAAATQQAK